MKKLILFSFSLAICAATDAQLKITPVCNAFVVDILGGKVNGVQPDFLQARIKKELPCFTSEEPEGTSAKCGTGVFYKTRTYIFIQEENMLRSGKNSRVR